MIIHFQIPQTPLNCKNYTKVYNMFGNLISECPNIRGKLLGALQERKEILKKDLSPKCSALKDFGF